MSNRLSVCPIHRRLFWTAVTLNTNRASIGAERIAEVLSERNDVTDLPGARPASLFRGHIEFRDITFGYEPEQNVLSHFDLVIEPGEKVAIMGHTGAGKTTLMSLIPRFYDPQSGCVLIDGHNIREFTIESLREQISMVLQDSLLFNGTIRDNIAFGRPDATQKEILDAAIAANVDDFVRKLPGGYASRISERGNTLSGGQKQRIAIARAILRNGPILILDEPTGSLDVFSEKAVMEAIQRVTAGRTTLIIAHRLATVRFADRIIVLDRGLAVEDGTHAERLLKNGV